jgi:ankyrin repeat protein
MIRKNIYIFFVSLVAFGYVFILFSKTAQSEESPSASLLKAIYARDFSTMDKLLAEGVDINVPIRNDLTPLAEAAFAGDLEVVDYLLRKGANVEGTKKLPNSPIYFAIFNGNTAVVRRFLDLGIPSNYTWPAGEGTGGTLLTAAVDSGHLEIVELLVQRGADVNFLGSANYSPLYRSMFYNYFDVFNFLLNKGAFFAERDKVGLSEWDKSKLNERYLELLKKKKGCNDKIFQMK